MQKTVCFCLRYALSLARYWMGCVPATRKIRFAIAPDFRYLYTRRIQPTAHETIFTRRMHASGRRLIFVLRKRRRRSLRHAHGPRMGRRPRILSGRLCAGQLRLLRGRRLRKRRTPLRRQRTPARHAQHPVGRLRRHGLHRLRPGRSAARTAPGPHPPRHADSRSLHRRPLLRPDHALHAVIQRHLLLYSAPRILAEIRGAFVWNGGCNSCCGRFRVTRPSPARRCAGR